MKRCSTGWRPLYRRRAAWIVSPAAARLGLEALSRGAASVTLLEQDRAVSAQLAKNLQVLQAQQCQVITADSLRWLAQPGDAFNVVFIDPPSGKA
ncbi:hypothetical protein SODG_003074 [Sodalis praecaptivus]